MRVTRVGDFYIHREGKHFFLSDWTLTVFWFSLVQFCNRLVLEIAQGLVKCIVSMFATSVVENVSVFYLQCFSFNIFSIFFL